MQARKLNLVRTKKNFKEKISQVLGLTIHKVEQFLFYFHEKTKILHILIVFLNNSTNQTENNSSIIPLTRYFFRIAFALTNYSIHLK